jgi:hypothetical protein
MKTQNTKQVLDFTKKSIIELTDVESASVNGGTGYVCSNCMTVTDVFTITRQIQK